MLDEAFAKRRRGESTDAEFVIVYCKMLLKAKFHANGTFDRIAASPSRWRWTYPA